jgi:hypothetical protein
MKQPRPLNTSYNRVLAEQAAAAQERQKTFLAEHMRQSIKYENVESAYQYHSGIGDRLIETAPKPHPRTVAIDSPDDLKA